jgi:predicted phosphodiesterase
MTGEYNFSTGKYSKYNDEIKDLHRDNPTNSEIAELIVRRHPEEEFSFTSFLKYISSYRANISGNLDLIVENVRLAKQKQGQQDRNRIERKSFREYARVENALESYNEELVQLLKKKKLSHKTRFHNKLGDAVGIFHFTDTHFNELVSLPHNTYDFTVASQRCKLFVDKAKKYFKAWGVKRVFFACTGDLMNSDRRLDELLNMSTNRSKATMLAVDLMQQMLLDLNSDYDLTVAYVTGNESRVRDIEEWSDMLATDNYDFTIMEFLRRLFEGSKGIKFIQADPREQVVKVANQNILLIHGNQKKTMREADLQQIVGKWTKKGVSVDFILFGHIHSAWISDWFARGASMVGDNDYSDKALQLMGRASQNIHILTDEGRDSIKIDLQNVKGVTGYNLDKSLEAYNAKSASKARSTTVIHQVTI